MDESRGQKLVQAALLNAQKSVKRKPDEGFETNIKPLPPKVAKKEEKCKSEGFVAAKQIFDKPDNLKIASPYYVPVPAVTEPVGL